MIISSTVRNFINYISEKMLVFENLECGVFFGQNGNICKSKHTGNVKKDGDEVNLCMFLLIPK